MIVKLMSGAFICWLKKTIYIFILLFLIVTNILSLTSAKVHDALYSALSHFPLSALTKNSPTKRYKKLSSESKALNKKLSKQNTKLRAKVFSNRLKVKGLSQKISKRTLKNIARNISSIPLESAPILGIGLVLAVTAGDIVDACNTMEDMDKIMLTLGTIEPNNDTQKVCGQKVPNKEAVMRAIGKTSSEILN